MRALDRDTHRGLWSALPTPWKADGALDAAVVTENCSRLAAAGVVDGIYTTDSDGEFYAIELDVFEQLARAFGRAMEQGGVDAAMGVTWSSTRGVIDRIKATCDAGVPNVHVAFPIFMPLAKSDVDRFFDDLAEAAPQARWIHYAHPRAGPALTSADYVRLSKRFPQQFIGTKLSCPEQSQLAEILLGAPQLSHFVVDPIMLAGMMLGARGCCSYWVNTLPRWQRRYMDACLANRWDEARQHHAKLLKWEQTHVAPLRAAGHLHGIIGKARAALSGFLVDNGYTQPPYYPIPDAMQAELKRAFEQYWAEELRASRSLQEAAT
jgi:dihydrodipicolinate synthase/N-acetylneuraminate lyase